MTRRLRPDGWWLDLALLAGFAALTGALAAGWFLDLDLAVRAWCDTHRSAAADQIARLLNYLGNGTPLAVLALALAAVVARRLRSLRPALVPIVAFAVTTGLILPLKLWTDRAAPRSTLPDAAELFNSLPPGEYGESYPSGHVVVAIVWYWVLLALLAALVPVPTPLRVAIRVAVPLIVFATTTYLSFHWLTDNIAGVCLGVVLARLLARVPWLRLGRVEPQPVLGATA